MLNDRHRDGRVRGPCLGDHSAPSDNHRVTIGQLELPPTKRASMKNTHPTDGQSVNNKVLAGQVQEVKGKVQKEVGKATGNERLQAHGEAEELRGVVKKKTGQIEAKIDEVTTTVKAKIHAATTSDKETS